MSESLGSAVLTVSVDDAQLKAGLQAAERQAAATGRAVEKALSPSGKPLETAANGLQYFVDAQGRARDASGKFLTVAERQAAGLDRMGDSASRAGTGVLSLSDQLIAFGQKAAGTLAILETIRQAAVFTSSQVTQIDSASAAVRTLGVDSSELITRLRALSVELDNNISTLDLTKAAYDVASSGFSNAADATQILRASALGAKGGFAEVNDVASALTGVINAYGLSASEASSIVDGFVQTQADGVITVRQYAAEIGNIASIAAASGVGIKELNAAIATATLRGVPVAQTFTGLRQALSSIIKPSEQAKELAESLGIQFNVGALQAKGLGGVLTEVQQKTGGAADKIAILLGSVEAQAAVQPLLNDRLVKYNELLGKQAQASGAAADAARINAGTISDGLKRIGNGFSNLATTLDKVLSPLFAGFISNINNVLAKLNQVSALSPDKVLAREREATDAVAGQLFPGQGSGFFGPVTVKYKGKTYKGSATGIREAILQDLLKGELAKINEATSAESSSTAAPASAAKAKPPVAEAEEYKRLTQEALDKQTRLNELKKTESQRWAESIAAANQLKSIQEEIAIQQQRGSLTGTGIGALQAVKQLEDAKRAEQDAQAALRANPGSSDLLNASKLAAENVKLAAAKTKADLQDAFKSAQDAVKSISRGIEDSVTALRELQNTSGSGLNRFLTPQQQADRQAAVAQQLRPEADALANQLGIRFQTSGTREQINQQLLDFVKAARQELRMGQDINQAQQVDLPRATADLAVVSEALVKVNGQLAEATEALANKDWNVYVNVPATADLPRGVEVYQ